MSSPDRYTKVVMTLLVLGVWGLLLRPLMEAAPAWAQKGRTNRRSSTGTAFHQYSLAILSEDEEGNPKDINFDLANGKGRIVLPSATALAMALYKASKEGWKVHSVIPSVGSTRDIGGSIVSQTSYVVIVEK